MQSIISAAGQLIDRRKLILSGSFFALSPDQADSFTEAIYSYVLARFGNECILDWKLEDRACHDIIEALKKYKLNNGAYQLSMQGNVICEEVYNKSSFRRYVREVCYPRFPRKRIGMLEAPDYERYYQLHISNSLADTVQFRKALLDLFDLEGKRHIGESQQPDLSLYLSVVPVEQVNERLMRGNYYLSVSAFCLGAELDAVAEEFRVFGETLCDRFVNTNVQIQLNTAEDVYSTHYGLYYSDICNAENMMLFWGSRHCYLPEIGWANIICDRSSKLGIEETGSKNNILSKKLAGGGTSVCVDRPISQTTIADLKKVKRTIYAVILPRTNTFRIADWTRPRRRWEVLPVFPEELMVTDCCIVFRHIGSVNPEYVYQMF